MSTDDTEFFPIDETVRRQFEAAWVAGAPQPIERFLPDHQHPNFLSIIVIIRTNLILREKLYQFFSIYKIIYSRIIIC